MNLRWYNSFRLSFINDRLFVIGCVLGFLYCVIEGHLVSRSNVFHGFKRFGYYDGLDVDYYPTIRQMRSLVDSSVLSHKRKDIVIVLVGGNSVLNGVGQSTNTLWSDRLQILLGDRFCVVNLSMRSSPPSAGAECLAEYYIKLGIPVVYVTCYSTVNVPPDGGQLYRYQYWQARYAGFCLKNPQRDKLVDSIDGEFEENLKAFLSEYLRFDDFWSAFTYKHASTVWISTLGRKSYYSHEHLDRLEEQKDNPPDTNRFGGSNTWIMDALRKGSERYYTLESGKWVEVKGAFDDYDSYVSGTFLPIVRAHTIMLYNDFAPYYVRRLTPAELERNNLATTTTLSHMSALGFTVVGYGQNFTDDDFLDLVHLLPSGGHKLADLLAPKILALSHQLYGTDETLHPAP